jgi:two-component system sensor histidine kinase RpfC
MRTVIAAARSRFRDRPDTEHEQAIVRLVVGIILFFYLLPKVLSHLANGSGLANGMFAVMVGFLTASALLLMLALRSRSISPVRRLISTALDIGTASYFIALLDMNGVPLLILYIWIAVANGFRYGQRYLLFALACSFVGFGGVVIYSSFWQEHVWTAVAMSCAAGAFCLYVLSLVRRMFAAVARAEAANQAKRRFISVVSHEMRTPLNAIIGMTDLLDESDLSAEQSDMVRTVTTASRALLRLVEDVLDFSKIEAGRLVVERTEFDLHALVNGTLRIIRPQAEAKGLNLSLSIMPEVPHALVGDPHHLRQVLINLATNAVKFTSEGSVIVHLSLTREEENVARVKFSVRDTGIGIPPEVQERIFESFVQADQSTTRQYGGTGLGTAIAKQLVELMGGRMGLESAVGLGSTFWFELEFAKQAGVSVDAVDGMLAGAPVLLIGFPEAERDALIQTLRGWGAMASAIDTIEAAMQRLAIAPEQFVPTHSMLLYAERLEEARHCLSAFHRATDEPPPLLLCWAPSGGRPARVPLDLAMGFAAVLNMPMQIRLLYNALHAVSALEERDTAPGVVHLRDYIKGRGERGGYRIVVADDSATNRQVIGKILERGGHKVTLVEDGEDVLDAIETETFDLVILDRNMPRLDGVATARALRTLESGRPRMPIAILSADATQETRDECLQAGADIFLPKPFEATRLLEQVSELCRSGGAHQIVASIPAKAPESPHTMAVANPETLRLLEELGSQPGFVERLVGTFVSDHVELIGQMERAISVADHAELRRLFHAMKGSAASLGAERLADLCGRLQKIPDAEMELRGDLAETIRQEFDRARSALDRYLEERRRNAG